MLKLVLKSSIFAILGVFCFIVISEFLLDESDKINKHSSLPKQSNSDYLIGIEHLNQIRSDLGLKRMQNNEILEKSAQNHAKYLFSNNVISHDEISSNANFTGETPSKRAISAGYSTNFVVENISKNQPDISASIDELLAAIYHRFGFLNYRFDEIGYFVTSDKNDKFYVYNMGNKDIANACKNGDKYESGYYITNLCKNNTRVSKDFFDKAIMSYNPPYITYPIKNYGLAYFSGEIPNPLPECKITSNPVSIEFNPKFGEVKMLDFEIFHNSQKITPTIFLDKVRDLNSKINENQFVLFSKKVFEFGEKYEAVFSYLHEDQKKQIKWDFEIKTPKKEYFSVDNGDIIAINADQEYDIFFNPKDCNDLFTKYSYSHGYFNQAKITQIGANMIRISLSGLKGDFIEIKTNTNTKIKAILQTSSNDKLNTRNGIIVVLLIVLVINLFMYYKRKKNG